MQLGCACPPEVRARISATLKNRKFTEQHRANLSVALRGRTLTTEHRAKVSVALRGRKLTGEHRIKLSARLKGSKNHQWLGGISMLPYSWAFTAELKEEVRRRDGYKCQLCGVSQMECKRVLSVHHIDYDKKNSDPVNLVTLCLSCHMRTNTNREHWQTRFTKQRTEKQRQISVSN